MSIELITPASQWREEIYSGDELLDSANEYFRSRAIAVVKDTSSYRQQHGRLPSLLTDIEADQIFERHQAMMFRVVEARRFLTAMFQDDLNAWQASHGEIRSAYKVVLADKIAKDADFRDSFFEGDEESFVSDCFNIIQWLDGWLQSEIVA